MEKVNIYEEIDHQIRYRAAVFSGGDRSHELCHPDGKPGYDHDDGIGDSARGFCGTGRAVV